MFSDVFSRTAKQLLTRILPNYDRYSNTRNDLNNDPGTAERLEHNGRGSNHTLYIHIYIRGVSFMYSYEVVYNNLGAAPRKDTTQREVLCLHAICRVAL
jgi:hypothetical protein